jgi:DNA-binding winged helix-turn-helix (wHTH) protein
MIYLFGDYELDTQLYELRQGGQPCPLESQVFDLLDHIIQHRDRVVTRQELLDYLWPEQFVTDAALTHRLMTARKVVGDSTRAQGAIKTVRGRGHRFVAAVQELVSETSSAMLSPPEATASPHVSGAQPVEADRRCAVCQHVNGAEALFCEACGGRLRHVCSACGQRSALSATFCPACGQPLSAAAPTALAASTPVVEAHDARLRASWEAIAGERKHVTVLYCTLDNASTLAERLGTERLHTVLHQFFDLALRHNGLDRSSGQPKLFPGIRHSVGWDASSFLKPAIPRLPHQDTPASSSLTPPPPPVQTTLSRAASCCEPQRHPAAAGT